MTHKEGCSCEWCFETKAIETAAKEHKRKVIQISALQDSPESVAGLYALCDDGTIWYCDVLKVKKLEWVKVQEIPQHE